MSKITVALVCLFAYGAASLHADLEDYFKPAKGKLEENRMRNIDFIYMINLDQRPEKYQMSLEKLEPFGIHPYRFSAVNGWELSLDAINDLGVKYESWMTTGHMGTAYLPEDAGEPFHEVVHVIGRNYFCHAMPKGSVGIVLSHLSILQDALDSGYETIWIMEDDIDIIQNPHFMSEYIDRLDALVGKNGWDILFTDQDTLNQQGAYVPCYSYAWRPNYNPPRPERFAQRTDLNEDFRQIGARYGAYSMIVRKSGMKKILNFIRNYHIFLPYDMEFTLPGDIRLFTVKNDVVSTLPRAISDNGSPNYKNRMLVQTPTEDKEK